MKGNPEGRQVIFPRGLKLMHFISLKAKRLADLRDAYLKRTVHVKLQTQKEDRLVLLLDPWDEGGAGGGGAGNVPEGVLFDVEYQKEADGGGRWTGGVKMERGSRLVTLQRLIPGDPWAL